MPDRTPKAEIRALMRLVTRTSSTITSAHGSDPDGTGRPAQLVGRLQMMKPGPDVDVGAGTAVQDVVAAVDALTEALPVTVEAVPPAAPSCPLPARGAGGRDGQHGCTHPPGRHTNV